MGMVEPLLRQYFQSKTRQLVAASQEAVSEHSGLRGSHREDVVGIYLQHVLPRRFEVGRGMVYGPHHRSREADVVIWDSLNYPSLPVQNHRLFFAESVRAVLEIKSLYSADEFKDILEKSRSVRNIVIHTEPNLVDDIIRLQHEVNCLRQGLQHSGVIIAPFHVGTGAIVLRGGQSLVMNSLTEQQIQEADESWPDVLLLLEPGRVVLKQYVEEERGFVGTGRLAFFEAGEDALLLFTAALLDVILLRSQQLENPLSLSSYMDDLLFRMPSEWTEFSLIRPVPGHSLLSHP